MYVDLGGFMVKHNGCVLIFYGLWYIQCSREVSVGFLIKPSSLCTAHLTWDLQTPDVHIPKFSLVLKLASTALLLCLAESIACLEVWPSTRLN